MDIGSYAQIDQAIKSTGMRDAEFAKHLRGLAKSGDVSEALASDSKTAAFAGALKMLTFGREAARNPMALLTAPMAVEMVEAGSLSWQELFTGKPVHNQGKSSEWGGGGMDPMSMTKAPAAAHTTYEQLGMEYPVGPGKTRDLEGNQGTIGRAAGAREGLALAVAQQKVGRENLVFDHKKQAEHQMARILIRLCQERYGKTLAPRKR